MLHLPGTLIHSTATASLRDLVQALGAETSANVVVDASSLVRFDSTALAVLLELRRTCLQVGKLFALQAAPPSLNDLARLYGIAELLPAAGTSPP
jgi:phospholipid transport system transporter-binding protein